jgi:hypothetical protein
VVLLSDLRISHEKADQVGLSFGGPRRQACMIRWHTSFCCDDDVVVMELISVFVVFSLWG